MSKTTPILHAFCNSNISLADALAATQKQLGSSPIAIVYSPQSATFAMIGSNGSLAGPNEGRPIDSTSVFEVRAFGIDGELRWLLRKDAKGHAVLIGETEFSLPSNWEACAAEHPIVATNDHEYLLWGNSVGNSNSAGWSRLATARIGAFDVPLANVAKEANVGLKVREYIARDPHGNAAVIDERLIQLVAKPKEH